MKLLLLLLALVGLFPPVDAGEAKAQADALAAMRRALPPERLKPPPEPAVKPIISPATDLDTNGDKIDDLIKPVGVAHLRPDQNEPIIIHVEFRAQVTQEQIDAFLRLGGTIHYIYQAVAYGFDGVLPRNLVERLPKLYGDPLVSVTQSRECRAQ
jgi:hypothetical protein